MSPLPSPVEPPPALEERALDQLRYIRRAMEEAGSFTTVSGWAQVGIGAVGLAAAVIASRQTSPRAWMTVWIAAAALGFVLSIAGMVHKARRLGVPAFAGPARRFVMTFCLPLIAGAGLTVAFDRAQLHALLPGTWLLLFGVGVASGGAFSVRTVPVMGFCFMALGLIGLFVPPAASAWIMALGFGALLIGFGIVIARRHGG